MDDFEFVEELPKRTGGQSHVDPKRKALADAARKRPGEWLKVPERFYSHLRYPYDFSRAVKAAQITAFRPKGSFDAKTREGVVYIKYLGET